MKRSVDPSSLLIVQISRLARLADQLLSDELAPHGLTVQEFRILGQLMGEEGISQKDLAERLSVRSATLSPVLEALHDRGVITRRASPDDARVKLIALDPDKTSFGAAVTPLAALEKRTMAGLSRDDRKILQGLLAKLTSNIDAAMSARSTKVPERGRHVA